MASNHKLTKVLQGRTVSGTSHASDGKLDISFTDGSTMTVKTAGNTNSASTGGTIRAIRQADTTLHLDFQDDTSLEIPLAEATSSVMVRDKNHVMEYAD